MSRSEMQYIKLQHPGEIEIRNWLYDNSTGIHTGIGDFIDLISNTFILQSGDKYSASIPNDCKNNDACFEDTFNIFKSEIRQLIINEPSLQHKQFILNDFKDCISNLYNDISNHDNAWHLNSLDIFINDIEGYDKSVAKYYLLRESICNEAIIFLDGMKGDLINLHPSSFVKVPLSNIKEACSLNPFYQLDILFGDIEKEIAFNKTEFYSNLADDYIFQISEGEFLREEQFAKDIDSGRFKNSLDDYINQVISEQFNQAFRYIEDYLYFNHYSQDNFEQIGFKILQYNTKLMSSKGLENTIFDLFFNSIFRLYNKIIGKFPDSQIIKDQFGLKVSSINLKQKFNSGQIENFINSIYEDGLFDVPNKTILIPYFTGGTMFLKIRWNLKANEYNFFFQKLSTILFRGKPTSWKEIEEIFHHNSVDIRKCILKDQDREKYISNYFNVFTVQQK